MHRNLKIKAAFEVAIVRQDEKNVINPEKVAASLTGESKESEAVLGTI